MKVITCTIDEFPKLFHNVVNNSVKRAKTGGKRGAVKLKKIVQKVTIATDAMASKELLNSWETVDKDQGVNNAGKYAVVGSQLPWSRWIEIGRRPGPISSDGVDRIRQWMHDKGKDPGQGDKHLYAIVERIRREGYMPKHVMERAINEQEFVSVMIQYLEEELERVNGNN